jgi:hypothetical protein
VAGQFARDSGPKLFKIHEQCQIVACSIYILRLNRRNSQISIAVNITLHIWLFWSAKFTFTFCDKFFPLAATAATHFTVKDNKIFYSK